MSRMRKIINEKSVFAQWESRKILNVKYQTGGTFVDLTVQAKQNNNSHRGNPAIYLD